MLQIILIILLILLLFGGLPAWGWHNYGYAPSGLIFFILAIVVIYLVATRARPPP
jgi:hypothetical protein